MTRLYRRLDTQTMQSYNPCSRFTGNVITVQTPHEDGQAMNPSKRPNNV